MEHIRHYIVKGMQNEERFLICKVWRSSYDLYPHAVTCYLEPSGGIEKMFMDIYDHKVPMADFLNEILDGRGTLQVVDESPSDTTYDFAYYWTPRGECLSP